MRRSSELLLAYVLGVISLAALAWGFYLRTQEEVHKRGG